ncbi:hypothetical protein SBBP1_40042 [Burkholderiales bacterium]|nr:hypothetical protein SBBP1_40042 [Burkholderiales bacterium]
MPSPDAFGVPTAQCLNRTAFGAAIGTFRPEEHSQSLDDAATRVTSGLSQYARPWVAVCRRARPAG